MFSFRVGVAEGVGRGEGIFGNNAVVLQVALESGEVSVGVKGVAGWFRQGKAVEVPSVIAG